eukprot:CAMPEP_0119017958 /NCGR_PEP_ID=MMETSP1176-20130426/18198_1 /TAXON_ID=265551 /ORGANISM="Synedropsis recta cf, Strain CCMP1620" /LENGTH=203 /DNA_ID=CAMNT_0006971835 /DNA_START=115 /DNA_END=722 /DNA_ORIENTATION=+
MWIIVACTIVWKRRMTRGGSSLARRLKEQALKKKRRRRRRLKDFLADDLLRKKMAKEFEAKMGKEACDRHMEELDLTASRDVTADDVQVSTKEVVGESTRRICLLYGSVAAVVYVAFGENSALVQFSVALIFHIFDNRLNLSTRKAKLTSWAWIALWIGVQIVFALFPQFDDAPPAFLLLGFVSVAGFAAGDSGSNKSKANAP